MAYWDHLFSTWKSSWFTLSNRCTIHLFLPNSVPYDPAIPLLGIYPDKTIIRKDTCTPLFTSALFIIAKTWKQPKCPSTDEWIKKMWYIYTMEYYSAIKKNEIMPFAATWMDLEIIILSEVSQTERQISYDIAYMLNQNLTQMGDFPGGPVVRILLFHCRGRRFDPWLGN